MFDTERYKRGLKNTIAVLEEDVGELPKSYKDGITYGYHAAACYWHNTGLTEGWNAHIEKLAQLMEPLGGVGDA